MSGFSNIESRTSLPLPKTILTGVVALALITLGSTKVHAGYYLGGYPTGLTATMPGGTTNRIDGNGTEKLTYTGGSATGYITGTLSTTFTWQPAYPGEPAPTTVNVLETITVEASAKTYPQGSPVAWVTTDILAAVYPLPTTIWFLPPGSRFPIPIGTQIFGTSTASQSFNLPGGNTVVVAGLEPRSTAGAVAGPVTGKVDYAVTVVPNIP